jgi:imidazolonepropionase-like amidohydrolase
MTQYRRLPLAPIILLFSGSILSAEVQNLSPEVQQFVRVQSPVVILAHVRVIDGTGKPAIVDQNVVIEHGKIVRTETAGVVPQILSTTVLDLQGHTVMPGIVGMHNHLYYIARPNLEPGKDPLWEGPLLAPQMMFSSPRLYLAAGVTTIRTTGSVEPYAELNLREQIDTGMLPGPHIDVTAPYLEGKSLQFIQMHQL